MQRVFYLVCFKGMQLSCLYLLLMSQVTQIQVMCSCCVVLCICTTTYGVVTAALESPYTSVNLF